MLHTASVYKRGLPDYDWIVQLKHVGACKTIVHIKQLHKKCTVLNTKKLIQFHTNLLLISYCCVKAITFVCCEVLIICNM
jgi:hypothetical protein